MSAVAARLLPRARPRCASAQLARRSRSAFVTVAAAKMEAVRFGTDKSIPGFVAGPKGAPGVIVIQECVAPAALSALPRPRQRSHADSAGRTAACALPLALTPPRPATAPRAPHRWWGVNDQARLRALFAP